MWPKVIWSVAWNKNSFYTKSKNCCKRKCICVSRNMYKHAYNISLELFLSWIWDVKSSKPTLNERTCIVKISSIPCYHFVKLDIQRFDSVRSFPPPLVSFFTFYHFHQHPLYSSRNFFVPWPLHFNIQNKRDWTSCNYDTFYCFFHSVQFTIIKV